MQSTSRRSSPSPGDSLLALNSILRNHGFVNKPAQRSSWLRNRGYASSVVAQAQPLFTNPWLRKLKIQEFTAKKESPSEGKDLLNM